MTFIAAGATTTLSLSLFGSGPQSQIALLNPSGEIAATTTSAAVPIASSPRSNFAATLQNVSAKTLQAKALVDDIPASVSSGPTSEKRNHTKTFIYGVVLAIVIALFVLLERLMVREE